MAVTANQLHYTSIRAVTGDMIFISELAHPTAPTVGEATPRTPLRVATERVIMHFGKYVREANVQLSFTIPKRWQLSSTPVLSSLNDFYVIYPRTD